MYLSDRDLRWALEHRNLIVDPLPDKIDPTSIDLHLDSPDQAKVWDIDQFNKDQAISGHGPFELRIGKFKYGEFAPKYLIPPPEDPGKPVFRRGDEIVIKPGGFLWQIKEWVGTPEDGANLIAFIDGKSTRARTGLLVHLTAPTVHASWAGNITLEIANLGPFHFVLEEGDAIAQIVVSTVSSTPAQNMTKSVTYRQTEVAATSSETISKHSEKSPPKNRRPKNKK